MDPSLLSGLLKNIAKIDQALHYMKEVLLIFGDMIVRLNDFVSNNEITLNGLTLRTGITEMPSWTGILYSTVSYFANCQYFNSLSEQELVELYLDISTTEESCAEQDVDYGHDQHSYEKVQEMGKYVAADWFNKSSESSMRQIPGPIRGEFTDITDEKIFSKNLIDNLRYYSVAQSYNRHNKKPVLLVNKTTVPDDDFMFNLSHVIPPADTIVNNIRPIGNAETWGSIDYTVGDPFINMTKAGIANEFASYHEFLEYFNKENIIEIRTPTTNFDAAAPSGCLYRNVEKMCVSYRKFTPTHNTDSTGDNSYIYVILTVDLDERRTNTLTLDMSECLSIYEPFNLFGSFPGSDMIIELMKNFSKPFDIIESKRERLVSNSMQQLISKCYNIPSSDLIAILVKYIQYDLISKIVGILDIIKSYNTELNQKGKQKMKDTKFKELVVPLFNEIISDIGQYYLSNCLERTCSKEIQDIIGNLLTIFYRCMFHGEDIETIKAQHETLSETEMGQSSEEAAIQSGEAVHTLRTLANTKPQDIEKDLADTDFGSQDDFYDIKEKLQIARTEIIQYLDNTFSFSSIDAAAAFYQDMEDIFIKKNIILIKLSPEERIRKIDNYIQLYNKHHPDISPIIRKDGTAGGKLIRFKNPRKTRKPNKHRLTRKKYRKLRGRKTRNQYKKHRYTRHKK